ncbi:hypothetical protein MSAN_01499800 [Mycena sanguinolenta]|uniref:Protein kinase domain-containing protein n=1 Tax=Mycena sanguinolenta TaxID=230812 RepID=A0A8H7CWI5_9AGAR|nr:hypothetical protein MSAN_01499800 [Mycena sanguinolenta]
MAPCSPPSSSMDPQADPDADFIVVSTSDYTESASYVLFVSAVVLRLNFTPLEISQHPGRIEGACARRIYHAEIRRDPGTVTVAMYQGEGAEEEWRQHVAKYESIRHPNIIQLYGLVSTKGLYAMVFHDGEDPRLPGVDLV